MEDESVTCLDCGRDARDAEGYSWPYPEREGLFMCDECWRIYWRERGTAALVDLADRVAREVERYRVVLLPAEGVGVRPADEWGPCDVCASGAGVLYLPGDPGGLEFCPACMEAGVREEWREEAAA